LIRENHPEWSNFFLSTLFNIPQSTLRDYVLKELNKGDTQKALIVKLKNLLHHPVNHPEVFVWYFQKIINKENVDLPFADKEGQCAFFESFLILLSRIEGLPAYRELVKKMYALLSGKRYATVRAIIDGTSVEFLKEFLLLVSKCQTFTDHDIKILRSLAEVVRPELAAGKPRKSRYHDNIIWTTETGYLKIQDRARHIGTYEIVENAREIESARALGDLRENSEYKFALEKRSRLQGELKMLSEQLKRARIISKEDISTQEVGVGSIVELVDSQNRVTKYTILGPWDADPESHILSFQSKLALAMMGLKIDESFQFRDEEYKIIALKSYLEK
jgi:transcription elongation GreA/GreB family factor